MQLVQRHTSKLSITGFQKNVYPFAYHDTCDPILPSQPSKQPLPTELAMSTLETVEERRQGEAEATQDLVHGAGSHGRRGGSGAGRRRGALLLRLGGLLLLSSASRLLADLAVLGRVVRVTRVGLTLVLPAVQVSMARLALLAVPVVLRETAEQLQPDVLLLEVGADAAGLDLRLVGVDGEHVDGHAGAVLTRVDTHALADPGSLVSDQLAAHGVVAHHAVVAAHLGLAAGVFGGDEGVRLGCLRRGHVAVGAEVVVGDLELGNRLGNTVDRGSQREQAEELGCC